MNSLGAWGLCLRVCCVHTNNEGILCTTLEVLVRARVYTGILPTCIKEFMIWKNACRSTHLCLDSYYSVVYGGGIVEIIFVT